MTTIETIVHLATTLLPTVSVLAFLLFHRRQLIRAELEDTRLHHEHHQRVSTAQTERAQALTSAAKAVAPALIQLIQEALRKQSQPLSAADLGDEDLLAELDRRVDEDDWEAGNPFESLDGILEHLWARGSTPPRPSAPPPEVPDIRAEAG